jgi:secreted trypsin-like serine protease
VQKVDDRHVIFGLNSNGLNCQGAKTQMVYTKVSAYLDWIEKIVW